MRFDFYSPELGLLALQPGLPDGFKGPFLRGSRQWHVQHEKGKIVHQQVELEIGGLQFLLFDFLDKLQVKAFVPQGLKALLVSEGNTTLYLPQEGRTRIKAWQFSLFHLKSHEFRLELPAKRTGLLLTSSEAVLTQELSEALPKMEKFLKGEEPGIETRTAHPAVREAVHQVLHAEYESSAVRFYFKSKLREYFFLLLSQRAAKEVAKLIPASWELNAVYRVRQVILSDILKHHSISDLARKEKINEFRLKVFFKREFGVGPFEFLLNARLEKAKELLEQGMPMKQAAPLAGYRTTSFITAFKRKYGYSPGAIQKKRRGE